MFRPDELPEHRPAPPPPALVKTVSPVQTIASPQSVVSPISNGLRSGTPTTTSSSWATVGKTGMTSKSISIAPVKPKERKFVLLNAYDQRIDEKLAKVERGALERFHAKIAKQKMCNEYHLKGACTLGPTCPYGHGEKLAPVDRLALQHKARNIPCSFLSDCREATCYYGHNCPYDECSRGDNCYFSMTHDMDRVSAAWYIAGTDTEMKTDSQDEDVRGQHHRNPSLGTDRNLYGCFTLLARIYGMDTDHRLTCGRGCMQAIFQHHRSSLAPLELINNEALHNNYTPNFSLGLVAVTPSLIYLSFSVSAPFIHNTTYKPTVASLIRFYTSLTGVRC